MSRYENYTKTSSNYDDNRIAPGLQIIRRLFEGLRPRSDSPRLLDAGCGTGAYLAALHGRGGTLVGLELNEGMLARARAKLDEFDDIVLDHGSVLSMPYGDGEFDLVMFNQVLHHLDGEDGEGGGWPKLSQALAETRRVLRANGVLLINTCTQQQLADGFWYAPLIPLAIGRMARRYIPVPALLELLDEHGLRPVAREVPFGDSFYGERALDPSGPFDAAWRSGDSVWALATPTELQEALQQLQMMHDAGTVDAFVAQREQLRRGVGQCIFIEARVSRPTGARGAPATSSS